MRHWKKNNEVTWPLESTYQVFKYADFKTCFAPQRRAIFEHLNSQKCSAHGVFCEFWLGNVFRAGCNFLFLIRPDGSAHVALASLINFGTCLTFCAVALFSSHHWFSWFLIVGNWPLNFLWLPFMWFGHRALTELLGNSFTFSFRWLKGPLHLVSARATKKTKERFGSKFGWCDVIWCLAAPGSVLQAKGEAGSSPRRAHDKELFPLHWNWFCHHVLDVHAICTFTHVEDIITGKHLAQQCAFEQSVE